MGAAAERGQKAAVDEGGGRKVRGRPWAVSARTRYLRLDPTQRTPERAVASFRRFQRRYLPFLPDGPAVRRVRDRWLRRAGLKRALEPALLTERPDLRFEEMLPLFLAAHLLEHGRLTLLQIGAFDGADVDLSRILDRYPVRGVLVEPQPRAFELLEARHGHREGLTLVNAAVDRESGVRTLYTTAAGASQTASFDRDHLLRHGVLASDIRAVEVPCRTVEQLLAQGGLGSVDLIQIDAEGHDCAIIAAIDLERFAPRILRFEHRHVPEPELRACLLRLAEHGYRFWADKLDVISVRSAGA